MLDAANSDGVAPSDDGTINRNQTRLRFRNRAEQRLQAEYARYDRLLEWALPEKIQQIIGRADARHIEFQAFRKAAMRHAFKLCDLLDFRDPLLMLQATACSLLPLIDLQRDPMVRWIRGQEIDTASQSRLAKSIARWRKYLRTYQVNKEVIMHSIAIDRDYKTSDLFGHCIVSAAIRISHESHSEMDCGDQATLDFCNQIQTALQLMSIQTDNAFTHIRRPAAK